MDTSAQVVIMRAGARRMAQETVIHRIDAQQAAGLLVTAVPGDLATGTATWNPERGWWNRYWVCAVEPV